jgi:hypothetical protein
MSFISTALNCHSYLMLIENLFVLTNVLDTIFKKSYHIFIKQLGLTIATDNRQLPPKRLKCLP